MKRKVLTILGLVVMAAMALAVAGCQVIEEIADALTSVDGYVVDARVVTYDVDGDVATGGLDGVLVQLIDSNDSVVDSDTTISDGSYTLDYTDSGYYTVRGTLSGYVVIDQEIYVGGWLQDIPNIMAIQVYDDDDISIIALWNDQFDDVDLYLTYPTDGDDGAADYGVVNFTSYDDVYSSTWATTGFGPSTSTNRERRYHASMTDGTTANEVATASGVTVKPVETGEPVIEMDNDERNGVGPEVFTIRTLPYWNDTAAVGEFGMSVGTLDLPAFNDPDVGGTASSNWGCIGVMELYVDAYGATYPDSDSEDLDEADVVVYITQGSTVLGKITIPELNNESVSVCRIPFYQDDQWWSYYYQFYPNVQIVSQARAAGFDTPSVFGAMGSGPGR